MLGDNTLNPVLVGIRQDETPAVFVLTLRTKLNQADEFIILIDEPAAGHPMNLGTRPLPEISAPVVRRYEFNILSNVFIQHTFNR